MKLRLDGSETSFEEAYPRAPFAPLIYLALGIAAAVARRRHAAKEMANESNTQSITAPVAAAGES